MRSCNIFRVLKNQEIAQRSKNERDSELRKNAGGKGSAGIAEMLKNPQMVLQKLVQGH